MCRHFSGFCEAARSLHMWTASRQKWFRCSTRNCHVCERYTLASEINRRWLHCRKSVENSQNSKSSARYITMRRSPCFRFSTRVSTCEVWSFGDSISSRSLWELFQTWRVWKSCCCMQQIWQTTTAGSWQNMSIQVCVYTRLVVNYEFHRITWGMFYKQWSNADSISSRILGGIFKSDGLKRKATIFEANDNVHRRLYRRKAPMQVQVAKPFKAKFITRKRSALPCSANASLVTSEMLSFCVRYVLRKWWKPTVECNQWSQVLPFCKSVLKLYLWQQQKSRMRLLIMSQTLDVYTTSLIHDRKLVSRWDIRLR